MQPPPPPVTVTRTLLPAFFPPWVALPGGHHCWCWHCGRGCRLRSHARARQWFSTVTLAAPRSWTSSSGALAHTLSPGAPWWINGGSRGQDGWEAQTGAEEKTATGYNSVPWTTVLFWTTRVCKRAMCTLCSWSAGRPRGDLSRHGYCIDSNESRTWRPSCGRHGSVKASQQQLPLGSRAEVAETLGRAVLRQAERRARPSRSPAYP